MKYLITLLLMSILFVAGCAQASNDRAPITLETNEAAESTEGTDDGEESLETEDETTEEVIEDIPEEYQGLGLEKFERTESGVTSNVTLEFEDNIVLQQTTENSGNFADVGLTLESATEENEALYNEYASIYDVTYETEVIYVGANEKVIIDYRNQRDEMEDLRSIFMDEIPKIGRHTTVEEAIEYFKSEGYTHVQD